MSATSGTVNSRVDKYGQTITVDLHTHKPCGHKDRCNSAKGGCPKCATARHRAEEDARNERNRQARARVAGR